MPPNCLPAIVSTLAVDVIRPRRAQQEHAAGGPLRSARAAKRDQHRPKRAHLLGDPELDLLATDVDDVRLVLDLAAGGGVVAGCADMPPFVASCEYPFVPRRPGCAADHRADARR